MGDPVLEHDAFTLRDMPRLVDRHVVMLMWQLRCRYDYRLNRDFSVAHFSSSICPLA